MRKKEQPAVAKRLKSAREAAGLSQQELAVKAGLSVSVVSQIEQGKKADPRVSTLMALSSALGIGIEKLTSGPGSDSGSGTSDRGRPRKGK